MSFIKDNRMALLASGAGAVSAGVGMAGLLRRPQLEGASQGMKDAHSALSASGSQMQPGDMATLREGRQIQNAERKRLMAETLTMNLPAAVLETLTKANMREMQNIATESMRNLTAEQLEMMDAETQEFRKRREAAKKSAALIGEYQAVERALNADRRQQQLQSFNKTIAAIGKMVGAGVRMDSERKKTEPTREEKVMAAESFSDFIAAASSEEPFDYRAARAAWAEEDRIRREGHLAEGRKIQQAWAELEKRMAEMAEPEQSEEKGGDDD